MAKQLGSSTGDNLLIIIPSRGELDWDQSIEDLCFIPISEHDHTGGGRGAQISTEALLDGAVTSEKIQDNAIDGSKLQDYSITEPKLADNSVRTSAIQDNAVSEQKIQDGAISELKLQDDSVTAAKLANNSVDTAALQDDSVTAAKLNPDVVGAGLTQTSTGKIGASVDNFSLELLSGTMRVKTHGININKLDPLVAGNGLSVVNAGIDVNVDGTTIQITNDVLNVPAIPTLSADISSLDSRVTSNDSDISSLDSRVTSNDSDISGLDSRLTTAESNITSNDSDISGLDSRVTTLENTGTGATSLLDLTDVGADGTSGQVLTTNGAGSFSFTTVSGGAGTASNVITISSDSDVQSLNNTTVENSYVIIDSSYNMNNSNKFTSITFNNCTIIAHINSNLLFESCVINQCQIPLHDNILSSMYIYGTGNQINSSSIYGENFLQFRTGSVCIVRGCNISLFGLSDYTGATGSVEIRSSFMRCELMTFSGEMIHSVVYGDNVGVQGALIQYSSIYAHIYEGDTSPGGDFPILEKSIFKIARAPSGNVYTKIQVREAYNTTPVTVIDDVPGFLNGVGGYEILANGNVILSQLDAQDKVLLSLDSSVTYNNSGNLLIHKDASTTINSSHDIYSTYSSGDITAPIAGKYAFMLKVKYPSSSAGQTNSISIKKNGTTIKTYSEEHTNSIDVPYYIADLAYGDVVTFEASTTDTASISIDSEIIIKYLGNNLNLI